MKQLLTYFWFIFSMVTQAQSPPCECTTYQKDTVLHFNGDKQIKICSNQIIFYPEELKDFGDFQTNDFQLLNCNNSDCLNFKLLEGSIYIWFNRNNSLSFYKSLLLPTFQAFGENKPSEYSLTWLPFINNKILFNDYKLKVESDTVFSFEKLTRDSLEQIKTYYDYEIGRIKLIYSNEYTKLLEIYGTDGYNVTFFIWCYYLSILNEDKEFEQIILNDFVSYSRSIRLGSGTHEIVMNNIEIVKKLINK